MIDFLNEAKTALDGELASSKHRSLWMLGAAICGFLSGIGLVFVLRLLLF